MEIEKLKKVIYGNKNVGVQHLKQLSMKLTEETTMTSVVNDLPKLIPAVFKYAVHEDRKFREAALPALAELAGLLDLNKHLKEQPWWTEMKSEILKSVDVLMNLVSTGDDQWSALWKTAVMMMGSNLKLELTLLNRLLKVVEKAFKMNDEEVRYQGFECWCKLIDNFSINKQEINNKRRLQLLSIPLKANNHNTPRLCVSKMKTWKHLLSKLDQHNEMTVQLLVTHFLQFMFMGVSSIAPACKTINTECASIFSQMLQTPLLFRLLPELFIKCAFICIESVHRDLTLCLSIWEHILDNMKSNQWEETHVSELLNCMINANNNDKLGKSKSFAHMIRTLYTGSHALPSTFLLKHLKTVLSMALEPHVLVNYTEAWCNELLNIVAETDPIQLPQNIVGDIISKLNLLAVSELFRDGKLKFLRGMWMTLTNIVCKWMTDDGQIGKNSNMDTDLLNIHQLLFYGAAPLSSTWNKLQMKSWKSLYSECVKYFSLSTEVKCEKFVSDLVELLLEGIRDKKIPLHVALDLVSIIVECHLSKDESSILPLMTEVAASIMNLFQTDISGASGLLNQYLKIILVASRSEHALVNDAMTVTEKMLTFLDATPLIEGHIEKTRNAILKTQIQLNALKPCRSLDRSESPGTSNIPPATSPTMTSFLHRLAKSKETKSKVSSPTPSQSSDLSSSPCHTPNSKKASSPFCDLKSEDFVFVPPKPRKILLTDHQKESLATRKHDIPALYQDLSQDSSQSPFDSIVTSAQAEGKEQMEKGPTIHSPNSFKEVNFRSLSPKKTLITNPNPTSEDKIQNNKENDCINNNTKSPIKSNSKENKISGGAEDSPLKVLQEDLKRSQDHATENCEISNMIPANTRLRSRKSDISDSKGNQSLTGIEENTKIVTSDLQENNEGTELECDNLTIEETLSSNEIHTNATPNNKEMKNKDGMHNVITPSDSITGDQTPKRSLRKNKLSISVKKNAKKNEELNKEKIDKVSSKLSLSDSRIKSPCNNTTPKVSPRRLRKRQSGVTPILTGGEFIKKARKSNSPLDNKDTPTIKTNKRIVKNGTSIDIKNDDNLNKNDTLVKPTEIFKPTNESVEHAKYIDKSISKSETKKSKIDSYEKAEKIKSTQKNTKEDIIKSSKSIENQNKVALESESDGVQIVAIIDEGKNESSSNMRWKHKEDSKLLNDECHVLLSKSHIPLKDKVSNVDMYVESCSPVKVMIKRLPDMILSSNQFEIQEIKESSGESIKIIEIKEKEKPVKSIAPYLSESDHDLNCMIVDEINSKSSDKAGGSNDVDEERESVTLHLIHTTDLVVNEVFKESKHSETKRALNNSKNIVKNEESTLSMIVDGENKKSENNNKLIEKVQSSSTDLNSSHSKKVSLGKGETSLDSEKCNGKINSADWICRENALLNETSEDSADLTNLEILKSPSTSSISDTNNLPSSLSKNNSSENTPVKCGQKHLKQTQLPFTPIRKTIVSESKSEINFEAESIDKPNPSSKEDLKGISPSPVLTKIGSCEVSDALLNRNLKSGDDPLDATEQTSKKTKTSDEESLSASVSETRQEVQRTPEKANTSTKLVLCLQRTEVEESEKSMIESPSQINESEDVIASSQETTNSTQSILVSYRNSISSNSLKLLSKSPKKCENTLQTISSSERVLRSSPSKTEHSRFTGTPVKKSVCRRLDVEIEESPESNEDNSLPANTGRTSPVNTNSEERSDDFKLLNGENATNTNLETNSLLSSRVLEVMNNLEDIQPKCADYSPRSHKNLKRFVVESDASCVGSPKRAVGSLKFEGNSSPISSPNSRTSQMMELAKQEKERTISSPIGSSKRRRILPTRVGSITRTPKRHIILRSHSGPSEEWVRRTYSPSASPNSSILKRTQPISPDCSPPSSKKKRVSFLDPPVSESLLFSKANPGKGQIQRPEPKLESESEELPSQGSLDVVLPETCNSEAKVFSPLKQCSSPLTDILERIVNLQWLPVLEAQLERLGVTTVGQLSSLPEETVQRLPFIPPKLERLRKILQNYYNEINEKPVDTRPICSEARKGECLSPDKDSSGILTSPEKIVENLRPLPENIVEDLRPPSGDAEPSDDISSIAESIKHKIEQYPELINKLGNTLHIDVVMKLLDFAVCKLKNENDKS